MSLFSVNIMSITQAFEHAIIKINKEPQNDVETWEREKYIKTVQTFFDKFNELNLLITNLNKGDENVSEEQPAIWEGTKQQPVSEVRSTMGIPNKGRRKDSKREG